MRASRNTSDSPDDLVQRDVTSQSTVPVHQAPRVRVRTLAVEVLEGPDTGKHAEADSEILTVGTAPGNVLVLGDPTVSGYHLELSRCDAGVCAQDLGSTNGTIVGDVRLGRATLQPGAVLKLGHTALRVSDGTGASVEFLESDELSELRGRTPSMRRVMAQVLRLARAPVPVLVVGDSGTGKELAARALHDHSDRSTQPFVTVDCGSLSQNLAASELFGHERGAFTGAERQHIGAFERANGGTLFLDEIGELTPELQPQLLGALERRRFTRVGGRSEIAVDVRVVCATNRDLRAEVNAGTFRMDLYYRIAIVVVRIPALRERPEDIPLLVEHFLRECGHAGPVSDIVADEQLESLAKYRWPGNVRELRNWVEATVAMGESAELLDAGVMSQRGAAAGLDTVQTSLDLPYQQARTVVLDDFEARYLARLIEQTKGNVSQASRQAKMDRSYLIKLLQKHNLR